MRATVQGTVSPGARRRDWIPVLAQLPLFAGVPKRHLRRIVRVATTRRFGQMTRIVQSGDAGNTFYVVLDGQVSILRNGRRVARLGVGEAFGKVLREEPTVSIALLRTLAERLRQSERSHAH